MQELSELIESARLAFAQAEQPAALEDAKARFLGKTGALTALMKELGKLPHEERRARGQEINRAKAERKANLRPPLQPIPDLSGYDIVCIGHPIWSGSMPMALYGFFESQDLSGKTLVHFNTHGGSGQGDSHREMARLEPKAQLLEGLAVYGWGGVRDLPSVERWLKHIGLIS